MRSETGLHRGGERVARTGCLEGVFQKKSSGEAGLEVKFSGERGQRIVWP